MEDLRERFFGPSLELTSHDKVSDYWWLLTQFLPGGGVEDDIEGSWV